MGSLPVFTVKSPGKVFAATGDTLTLNCSATGDPRPVISWKRQGLALPVGRIYRTNKGLTISDLREEDSGIYTCVATGSGVFHSEATSYVEIREEKREVSDKLVCCLSTDPLFENSINSVLLFRQIVLICLNQAILKVDCTLSPQKVEDTLLSTVTCVLMVEAGPSFREGKMAW